MSIHSLLVNSLTSSLEVCILVTDAQGLVQWCNAGFTAMSGYTLDELQGRKPGHVLQCEGTDARAVSRVSRYVAAGLPVVEELLNQRKDGARYWTRLQILPIHAADGRLDGFMSLQHDATGEMERRRRASQVFEDQLLSTFSHEVRTPLNAVCNLIDLLRVELGPAIAPEVKRLFDLTTHASDGLLRLVNDVLDVSRLKSGRFRSEPGTMKLSQIMAGVSEELSSLPTSPSVELTVVTCPHDPLLILDGALLHRVLVNLAGNALKFTEQGSVEVRVEINPALSIDESWALRFSVTDTGIGIEPSELDRLILPFEQGEQGSVPHLAGVGLGLALCEQMLRAMGSRLQVISTLGTGSCFWFEILVSSASAPLEAAQNGPSRTAAGEMPEPPQRLPLSGLRLLLVDDNPLGLTVAHRQLERLGAQVTCAASGRSALKALSDDPRYDLVLMDLHMPHPDGFETTRQMRALAGCERIPVVALSAGVAVVEKEAALAATMCGFIDKPFTAERLMQGIKGALNQGRDP